MGQNQAQNQVFCYFFKFGSLVFLEIAQDDSLEHGLTISRGKTHEKKLGVPKWVQNQGFCHFLKVPSLVFIDIAQDCSLGQCLTASRAETSKKKIFQDKIGAKMIFSILMLLSINSNQLVLVFLVTDLLLVILLYPVRSIMRFYALYWHESQENWCKTSVGLIEKNIILQKQTF